MDRRKFIALSSTAALTVALEHKLFGTRLLSASAETSVESEATGGASNNAQVIDAEWYRHSRKYVKVPGAKVAYVEHGRGPAALFIHGLPLNGYQWRGALERLHPYRRCIAPDVMSMGQTETDEGQAITPDTQAEMLRHFLDALQVKQVDLVANDSGGMVAQVFVAKHPERVRTLLLTNCDVDENNPPQMFLPAVVLAKKGEFTKKFLLPQVQDKNLARTAPGMLGSAYTHPERVSDETLDIYLQPLVASESRMRQLDEYTLALGVNELVGLREKLKSWPGRLRMVWAVKDKFFPVEWADWLDRNLKHSTGVRRLEEANLFFPEEMPDVIAEEARTLWGVKSI